MTSDFGDRAIERDSDLVKGLCYAALSNRRDLHEWLEEEVKAVLVAAEFQESLTEGVIRDNITKAVKDLRRIALTDLPEAIREHDEVRSDIEKGGYDDVIEAYHHLERETARLVAIARDVLRIREFIAGLGGG